MFIKGEGRKWDSTEKPGGGARGCFLLALRSGWHRAPWDLITSPGGGEGAEGKEVKLDEGVKNPKWGYLIGKLPGICHRDNRFKNFLLFSFF